MSQQEFPTEENANSQGIADLWAQAFIDRNASNVIKLATENVVAQLIDEEILDEEQISFGWSSPWPVFPEEHYRIIQCDNSSAKILYYALDSTPHVYVWEEELKFEKVQEEVKVSSWSLKQYHQITNADDFHNAYPDNQITNTPIDYWTNGFGEALNNNALLSSSEVYRPLFDPGTAALDLLNISREFDQVQYKTEENNKEVIVHLTFLNENGTYSGIDVTMWQPYGDEGIWIPKTNEVIESPVNQALGGNPSNADYLINIAEKNVRDGYKQATLIFVDNAEVGWNFYNENPWESNAERDALAQAALKELYTLTGYQVDECTYTTDGRSRFVFGKSAENIKKCIAFYSRDYGFTLCGDSIPYMGYVNARRAHYSDVQQLDSPYEKEEYTGQAAIPMWFLEHSGVYRGETITGFDAINLDDTVYTHIKLNFDGGYYLVVMDEKIEAVHEVSGPY